MNEHPGKGADQVEDAAERYRPGEPRAPWAASARRPGAAGRGDQPQHIFGDEESADDLEAGVERRGRNRLAPRSTVSASMIAIPTATITWCTTRNTRAAGPGLSGSAAI